MKKPLPSVIPPRITVAGKKGTVVQVNPSATLTFEYRSQTGQRVRELVFWDGGTWRFVSQADETDFSTATT